MLRYFYLGGRTYDRVWERLRREGKETSQRQQLADAVNAVMAERGWSNVAAQVATGVNRSVIHNMRQGIVPSAKQMVKWADGLCADCDEEELRAGRLRWLLAAGFDFGPEGSALSFEDGEHGRTPAETREPIFDALIEAGYRDLDPEDREEIVELIRLKHARLERRKSTGARARTEAEEQAERERVRELERRKRR